MKLHAVLRGVAYISMVAGWAVSVIDKDYAMATFFIAGGIYFELCAQDRERSEQ